MGEKCKGVAGVNTKVKNISLSLFIATLLFVTSVTAIGAVLISYEVKQFHTYVEYLSRVKQKVILLGLLAESELRQNRDLSAKEVESNTEYSFQDAVYSLKPNDSLNYVEAVARKVFHQAEQYLSSVYQQGSSVLYFRSYSGNKLILEYPIDGLKNDKDAFDLALCAEEMTCLVAAWKGQLVDRVLISLPFKSKSSNEMALSIMSPVYYKGELVGEFGSQIYLEQLYGEGKSITTTTTNGSKQIIIYFSDYPWEKFAYTQSFMADNTNLIVYQYPFSKVIIDYSFLYVIYFIVALAYFVKVQESKQSRLKLATALTDVTKDELTGLFNRRVYKDKTFQSRLVTESYSVLAIDGDRIKRINDRYGHHVGDEVISIIANTMKKVFRNSDYLIRTGGDEFVAILPGCSRSQASILATKLQAAVKENRLKTLDIEISISVGLASGETNENVEDVIVRADEALYKMKQQRV